MARGRPYHRPYHRRRFPTTAVMAKVIREELEREPEIMPTAPGAKKEKK
jgi:hypothetical protein